MSSRILILTSLIAAWMLALPGAASPRAASAPVVGALLPAQDVSLPFWCDWGYDWDERCYHDDSDRLPIGGDVDKVWRAALRFSLAGIPPDSVILEASLSVAHDGICLGPRKLSRACSARSYAVDLHAIQSHDWFDEREVEFGPPLARAVLASASRPERLTWDVTDLVVAWIAGDARNDGILLKLVDEEEDFGVSGPKVPSSRFADASRRPALDIVYLPPDA